MAWLGLAVSRWSHLLACDGFAEEQVTATGLGTFRIALIVLHFSTAMAMTSTLRTTVHSPMFWLLILMGLAAVGSNLTAGDGGQLSTSQTIDAIREPNKLMREGSRIESKMMVIRSGGENLILESEEEKQTFEALENLALERVLQAVRADSNDKRWLVTGHVTEYRGRNFIFLERVSRAPRAAQ